MTTIPPALFLHPRAREEFLGGADRLLGTATASTTGVWPRAVALLLRHALEEALRRYWQAHKPQLARCPPHAQALCLEEMLGVCVPAGAVFHIKSKRRREIGFTPDLRAKTEAAAQRLHELVASGTTPPPVLKARCRGCSLNHLCLPELLSHRRKVAHYCRALFLVFPE